MKFGRHFYPDRGRLTFDGGLNTKYPRSVIAENESPDCLNVVFEEGAVQTRPGYQKLNTATVGTFSCDGLYTRHDQSGNQSMVAFFGGKAYEWTGTTFTTIPSAISVFTAGTRVGMVEMENYAFFNNGQIGYKWNGANWNRHGVYPPTSAPTVVTHNAGGNLIGDYQYKVTYRNSAVVESDVGSVSATFTATAAGESLEVSLIPVAPTSYGVAARVLYRKSSAGSTFKRVAVISDNSTTTYTDNIADSALTTDAPTDQGVPPKYTCAVYHQDRLFFNDTAEPNYVLYSELSNPYVVKTTNFIRIGDNSSDIVRGLAVFDNGVYVFCDNSTWLIYTANDSDPANWAPPIRINSPYGSKSPYGIVNSDNRIFHPITRDGILLGYALIEGGGVTPSATLLTSINVGSDRISDEIEPEMADLVETYVGNISTIIWKNMILSSVTSGSGQTTNNKIWMFDISRGNLDRKGSSWAPWSGLNAAQFTILDGSLYFGSSTANGYVYKVVEGLYSDDSAAINSYYWTKEFGGNEGDFTFTKDFRFANLLVENAGAWYMQLKYRVDSDKGTGDTSEINLDPGSNLWGTLVWGVDEWGGGSDQSEVRVYLANKRGRRIQFQFNNKNTAGNWFKIHALNFVYNVKGLR